MVGTKPVSARFSLLPDTKPRMGALGTSLIIQICSGSLSGRDSAAVSPAIDSESHVYGDGDCRAAARYSGAPAAKTSRCREGKRKCNRLLPRSRPVDRPKLDVAKFFAPRIEAPKAKPRQVEADLPKVNDTFQPLKMEMAVNQPARPREPVKTGMMTGGSSAVPTIESKPLEKVQTGGFGDPNGVAGPSDPNKRANIGQFGNPALPPGPGYGNGTGGANGARGIVASTGFGNGVAIPPSGGAKPKRHGASRRLLRTRTIRLSRRPRRRRTTAQACRVGRDFIQAETGLFGGSAQAEP